MARKMNMGVGKMGEGTPTREIGETTKPMEKGNICGQTEIGMWVTGWTF